MRAVRISLLAVLLIVLGMLPTLGARGRAQETPAPAAAAAVAVPPEISETVKKQFGDCFKVATSRSPIKVQYLHPVVEPWLTHFTADLDGDGSEDLVVVTRCGNPLIGAASFDYTVVDPYYASNGYGNPRITAQFNSGDPGRNNLVLIILGNGPEGWKAEKPKAKWVLINLPFDRIASSHVILGRKKKERKMAAVGLEENEDGGASVVFWDGKHWRWQDVTGH